MTVRVSVCGKKPSLISLRIVATSDQWDRTPSQGTSRESVVKRFGGSTRPTTPVRQARTRETGPGPGSYGRSRRRSDLVLCPFGQGLGGRRTPDKKRPPVTSRTGYSPGGSSWDTSCGEEDQHPLQGGLRQYVHSFLPLRVRSLPSGHRGVVRGRARGCRSLGKFSHVSSLLERTSCQDLYSDLSTPSPKAHGDETSD